MHGIYDDCLYDFVVVGRKGLVSRLKIENSSQTSLIGYTAAEYLSAFEPPHKDNVLRSGDIKGFPVHLLLSQHKRFRNSLRNRMGRIYCPNPFIVIIPPFQTAGSAGNRLKDLGFMTGVKHNQSHPLENSLMYPFHNLIADFSMRAMPPTVLPVLRAPAETRPSPSALSPIVPE